MELIFYERSMTEGHVKWRPHQTSLVSRLIYYIWLVQLDEEVDWAIWAANSPYMVEYT